MQHYKKILVGIDAVDGVSNDAFNQACSSALAHNATLYIVSVIDTKSYTSIKRFDPKIVKRAEQQAHETLETYKQHAEAKGISDVQIIVDSGSPKMRIARHIAPNHDIDLIIVGATEGNKVDRAMLGSVSDAVLKLAACDVLIVREKPASF